MAIDSKYGRVTFDRSNTIGDDEPVVVFRAQDELLVPVLEHYYDLCMDSEAPQSHVDNLIDLIDTVRVWQSTNHTQIPQSAPPETV